MIRRRLMTVAASGLAVLAGMDAGSDAASEPLASVVSSSTASSSSAESVNQHDYDPGDGYTWSQSDACPDSWLEAPSPSEDLNGDGLPDDPHDSACFHADVAVTGGLPGDDTSGYDSDYLSELAGTPKYCSSGTSRIAVLYVTTQGGSDRYADLKPTLRDKAERADYFLFKSAQATGGNRHFRYVCNSGNIQITKVVLPNIADNSFGDTIRELRQAGYDASNRKYLTFVDWREYSQGQRRDDVCGRANIFNDDRPGQANFNNSGDQHAAVYLKADYCLTAWAQSSLHELGHTLGAVQQSAPRHDGTNNWHPTDEWDVMAYGAGTSIVCDAQYKDQRYDCSNNDYFDTSPSSSEYLADHWNTANNKFLVGS